MRIIVIFFSLFLSVSLYAQGGGGGSGPPGIILKFNDQDIFIPGNDLGDYGKLDDATIRDLIKDQQLNPNIIIKEKVLDRPFDLEIRGAGVVDLQTFKSETPKSLWREEDGKVMVDSRVPLVNWQDEDGNLHDLD